MTLDKSAEQASLVHDVSPENIDLQAAEPQAQANEPVTAAADAAASSVELWSSRTRQVMGAMALVGLAESALLSYSKLFNPAGVAALCGPSGGCHDVLTGPYSSFLGVPLTVPAMAAYSAVAALALVPLLLTSRAAREAGADAQAVAVQRAAGVDGWTRSWLLVITTAMATFSAYLMGVLAFRIGAFCPYCFLSAALSFGMCAIAWAKGAVPGKTRAAVTGLATVLITAMGALGVFVITEITISDAGAVTTEAMRPPSISTASTPQSVRLAKRLEKLDAAMYGAYWCSHCHHQKELFGAEAFARIKYVECSTKGWQERADLCRAKDVPGYPTWEINGELYPGEKSLEELERISGLAPYKQP